MRNHQPSPWRPVPLYQEALVYYCGLIQQHGLQGIFNLLIQCKANHVPSLPRDDLQYYL